MKGIESGLGARGCPLEELGLGGWRFVVVWPGLWEVGVEQAGGWGSGSGFTRRKSGSTRSSFLSKPL